MHQLEDLPVEVFVRLADFVSLADFVRLRAVSKATSERVDTLEAWWKVWRRRRGEMVSSTKAYGEQIAKTLLQRPSQDENLRANDIKKLWSMSIWRPYCAQWTKLEPHSSEEASPEARSGAVLQRLEPEGEVNNSNHVDCTIVMACGCAGGRLNNDVWKANIFNSKQADACSRKLWEPLNAQRQCVIRPPGRDSSVSWMVKDSDESFLRLFGGRLHVLSRFIPLIAAFNRALCDCDMEASPRFIPQETASYVMATTLQYDFTTLPNPSEYSPGRLAINFNQILAEGGDEILIMLLLEFVHHHELIQDPSARSPLGGMQNNIETVMLASTYALMEVVCSFYYAFSPSSNALLPTESEFEQQLYVAGCTERIVFVETNWCWSFNLFQRVWSVCSASNPPSPRSGHSIVDVFSSEVGSSGCSRYSIIVGGGSGKFLFEERPGSLPALSRSAIRFRRENIMFYAPETTYINCPLHTIYILDRWSMRFFETSCTAIPRMPKARNGQSCCSLPNYSSMELAHSLMFGGFEGRDESSEMWNLILHKRGGVDKPFEGIWTFIGSEEEFTSIPLADRIWKCAPAQRRNNPVVNKWPARRVDASINVIGEFVVLYGGYSTATFDDCWIFDPHTLLWNEIQQRSRNTPFQMPARRQLHPCGSLVARRPLARTSTATIVAPGPHGSLQVLFGGQRTMHSHTDRYYGDVFLMDPQPRNFQI